MASPQAIARLKKEYKRLLAEPVPNIEAHPDPSNILEWHYILTGSADSPYTGGVYHGKIVFPTSYPYKPPSIQMFTPSGRFMTNTKICMSMSDFHPETWNPLWSVSSILTGLLSFMSESAPTYGSMDSSIETRKTYAIKSMTWNLDQSKFRQMFPDFIEKWKSERKEAEMARKAAEQEAKRSGIELTVPVAPVSPVVSHTAHPDSLVDQLIIGATLVLIGAFVAWIYM